MRQRPLPLFKVLPGTQFPKAARRPMERQRYTLGLCIKCGKEPLSPGKAALGGKCQQKNRDFCNLRHERLAAAGLCAQCGRVPPTHGQLCDDCYEKHRGQNKKSEAKRIKNGICERCPNPIAATSSRLCERHVELRAQQAKRRRRALSTTGAST
jgi:NMD protein affecting ribosome stability and mRNA decay